MTYTRAMSAPAIEFWFEFASTYSYLAASRIERLAQAQGVTVTLRPFLLGPIFAAQGLNNSPFNVNPVKGKYMWRDMERLCAQYGLPFTRPSVFPRAGLLPARIACAHADAPWLSGFVQAVYRANFGEDRDTTSEAVLAAILNALNVDAHSALERAHSAHTKALLRAQTDEAISRGIFGAPSFLVGHELFWGNDRLEAALDWAVAHPKAT